MTSKELKHLRKIAEDATPGPWGPWTGNYPFNVDVVKPAPSLSKHDAKRPTYWRYQDGAFVLAFNPQTALALLDRISDLEEVLEGKRSLTRELDVALCGDDAAKQPSLCDLVGPVRDLKAGFDRAMQALRIIFLTKNKCDTDHCAIANDALREIEKIM